jgi:hypothetical protein
MINNEIKYANVMLEERASKTYGIKQTKLHWKGNTMSQFDITSHFFLVLEPFKMHRQNIRQSLNLHSFFSLLERGTGVAEKFIFGRERFRGGEVSKTG